MASRNNELQYISVDDFSPGVWANFDAINFSPGTGSAGISPTPKGAAQLTGTFGCLANQQGALTNTFALGGQITETPFDTPYSGNHILGNIQVIGMRAIGPIYDSTVNPTQIADAPDIICMAYQYFWDPTNTATNFHCKARYRMYKVYGRPYPFLSGVTSFDAFTRDDAVAYNPGVTTNPVALYGAATIDITRVNNAAPNVAGNPTMIGNYYPTISLAGTGGNFAFPSQASPGTDSTATITFTTIGAANIGIVFSHQDRIVGLAALKAATTQSRFGTNQILDPSDYMEFLAVNTYSGNGGVLFMDSDNPTGYGAWKSMNASNLLLVKKQIGGVIVSGPLEQPTITRMPGIPGTGHLTNIGCISPQGEFVYGTPNGVVAWAGGDSVRLLSPQLDGPFWAESVPQLGPRGSFCTSGKWIFAPRNWVYDSDKGSWWKLKADASTVGVNANTGDYVWYENSSNGRVIAGMQAWNGTNNVVIQYLETFGSGNAPYSWTSHPFAESVNRELDIREVNCTYVGGPFTVTITGRNGATVTETFPATSDTTTFKTFSINTDMETWDGVVNVATNVSTTISRLSLGYKEQEMAR